MEVLIKFLDFSPWCLLISWAGIRRKLPTFSLKLFLKEHLHISSIVPFSLLLLKSWFGLKLIANTNPTAIPLISALHILMTDSLLSSSCTVSIIPRYYFRLITQLCWDHFIFRGWVSSVQTVQSAKIYQPIQCFSSYIFSLLLHQHFLFFPVNGETLPQHSDL